VVAHSAPFRDQGALAEQFVVPASAAAIPLATVPFETTGAFRFWPSAPTRRYANGISISDGETVLVNGAGGVTRNLLVQLAAQSGTRVIATQAAKALDGPNPS
jgi:NADPH:quinone reductase-like Zn-dependent oxidoreductase